jgi:CelD/BcsL family acetyltransferase involved in cellulose biosynthesis
MRRAPEDAEITYQGVDDPAALSAGMEVFFDLHRRSEGEKAAFMTEQMKGFFRAMAAFSLERRWLELRFLLIDGYRAASLINFAYGNDILAYNVGYDPDRYAYLSSGTVLFAGAIREAIERGKSTFDFLRGSEEYKYRFGAQDTPIYQLTIGK